MGLYGDYEGLTKSLLDRLDALEQGGGGGGTSGVVRVLGPFTVQFDNPNLNTGAEIGYTPTVGDWIYDIFWKVPVDWTGGTSFASMYILGTGSDNLLGAALAGSSSGENPQNLSGTLDEGTDYAIGINEQQSLSAISAENGGYWRPVEVLTATPMIVTVGDADGAVIDNTAGQLDIYIVVSTPDAGS